MTIEICAAVLVPEHWDVLEMGCPHPPMGLTEVFLTAVLAVALVIMFAHACIRQE